MWGRDPASSRRVKSCSSSSEDSQEPWAQPLKSPFLVQLPSGVRKEVIPGRVTPGTCVLRCAACSCQQGSPWGLIPGRAPQASVPQPPPTVGSVLPATGQCFPASLGRDGFVAESWAEAWQRYSPCDSHHVCPPCGTPFGEQKATGSSRRRGRPRTGVQWSRQETKEILAPGFLQKAQAYMSESRPPTRSRLQGLCGSSVSVLHIIK